MSEQTYGPGPQALSFEDSWICTRCGGSLGRHPSDGRCYDCNRNAAADLWALARGILFFLQCEIEADRCGWQRLRCSRCGRTMPEVDLKPDYDGYECADNSDCWREIEAERERRRREREAMER